MVSKKIASASLGLALIIGFAVSSPGCGEAPPPPVSDADFEAAKKQQEDIMARERAGTPKGKKSS